MFKNVIGGPNFRKPKDFDVWESVNGTKQRLIKSVEIRLRSDVPIAFCLSGGIDSNALIGIAKNNWGMMSVVCTYN